MMTLDNLQPVDSERIFASIEESTLKEITRVMGNKVVDIWLDTGLKQAHREFVMPHEVPKYLESYIKGRYRDYTKNGNH